MSRVKKIFCSLFLALSVLMTSTTAFATGNETWYLGQQTVGSFVVTNDNLTPVKTMGDDGKLFVWANFSRADSASYPPIVLTFEIRDYDTGEVLDSVKYYEGETPSRAIGTNVTAGQRIQVYFDVSSQYNPPGPYRQANVTYGYILFQDELPPQ